MTKANTLGGWIVVLHQGETPSVRAPEADDAIAMARIADGDHDAFAAVVREHERWARTLALRMLGDLDEAEDAVQDAFINLWTGAPQRRWRGSLRTFVAVLVTRRCMDRLRRRGRETTSDDLDAFAAPEKDEPMFDAEEGERLRAAIERLPERQRAAVLLFHGEEMSLKEGAEAMDLSPKAFESLLIRARRALKRMVAP